MAKAKNLFFTALLGAAGAASFFLGDDAYKKLIYADRSLPDTGTEDADVTEMELEAIDYVKLHACFYKPQPEIETHDYMMVLADAKSGQANIPDIVDHYRKAGMYVLLPDARGCGKSGGRYLGYGYDDRLDVISWIHRILKQDPQAKIALHGLGTGAASALLAGAEHLPAAVYAVISDSCFTTLSEYLERQLRFVFKSGVPVKIRLFLLRLLTLARAGYDIRDVSPEQAVESMNVPTLFLHGDADRYAPVDMCRTLYRKAGCTRQIGVFLGASHLEGASMSPDRYFSQIDAFLSRQHPDRL